MGSAIGLRPLGVTSVALTDFSDLYGSFHWEGRLCCRPHVAPEVLIRDNLVVTVASHRP